MGMLNLLGVLVVLGVFGCGARAEKCAGCPSPEDPNDADVRNFLTKAVQIQNAKSNEEDITITSIDKVSSQVVAGRKMTFDYHGEGQKSKKTYNCYTAILLQLWLSPEPQILEHKCTSKKSKREAGGGGQLIGGAKEVSEEEELAEVRQLIQAGLETLDELDADDYKRVLVRLIEAKKQLVNGILYRVTASVKTTPCPETARTEPPPAPTASEVSAANQPPPTTPAASESCLSQQLGPQKICKMHIYRSFAEKSPHAAKVVKSECDTVEERESKSTDSSDPSGGSDQHHIDRAAKFATRMINNALNSINIKGLLHVVSSDSNISGDRHEMSLTLELADTNCTKRGPSVPLSQCSLTPPVKDHMICSVDLVHDLKSEEMKLTSDRGINCNHVSKFRSRAKRELVGDERRMFLSDEGLKDLKEFVVAELNRDPYAVYKKDIASIVSASSQVLSGRVVKMLVEVGDTDCLRDEATSSTDNVCNFRNNGRMMCRVSIWEKPWLNQKELLDNECKPLEPTGELLGVDESDPNLHKFQRFTRMFDKSYGSVVELQRRFKIFRGNMKKADYLQKTEQGTATYGATIFSDLTSGEFKKKYLGLKVRRSAEVEDRRPTAQTPDISLPEEYDWRSYNIVTPVKNQGACGSCWAFSVTGNIEGQYALKTGKLVSLSEQELVDCDHYDSGCEGGLFDSAYHAIEELGGLETESDYPYTARDGTCRFKSSEVKVSISSSVNISSNETDMAKWLVANGPISIALNANAMQFYLGGVSHPLKVLCSPKDLDHGVLLVGYGVHTTWLLKRKQPYWLIKNSWGTRWGHSGYYMLYRGDGSCGVNQMPSSAQL